VEGKGNCRTNLKVQKSKHGQILVASISILHVGVVCYSGVFVLYIGKKQKMQNYAPV